MSERKQAYWQEQERVTVPTKEITLEKDVANIYDLVAASVQMNVGEEEKALEQDKEVAKEVEYVEEFEHTPASEAVYEIPFQAMRKYQRKYLNMRRHFWN